MLSPALPVRLLAQGIAGAVEVGGAGERQVLEIGAERIGDRGQHRVGALAGVLDHHVADIVDHVGVVAEPARHGVGAGAAVEDVVAGIAGEAVGQGIAGAVDVGISGQDEVQVIGAQRIADTGCDSAGIVVADSSDAGVVADGRAVGCPRKNDVEGLVGLDLGVPIDDD